MLTLICGLPNAGKTTYSARYKNALHYDDYRDYPTKADRVASFNRIASEADGDICCEGIYNTAEMRKSLVKACAGNSPKICIWLDVSVGECIKRENRGRPKGVVKLQAKRFEPPTLDEGWDEIIIIRGDAEDWEYGNVNVTGNCTITYA